MNIYLEKALRQDIEINIDSEIYQKLPLAYKGRYDVFKIKSNGVLWMAIQPKEEIGLIMLRKDRARIEQISRLNCAIFLDTTSFYIKEKLIDEGIPFVIKDKLIFLPFLGYLLNNLNDRKLAPVHMISYLTQKMLLIAIYERWNEVGVTRAAKELDVSKKSVSRCFDELEYLNIDVLGMKGKSRVITIPNDLRKLWKQLFGILRNPVIHRFIIEEDVEYDKKAGVSALCEYSLLSDNRYPTYAITKKEITGSGIKTIRQIGKTEEIGCVVLELGYFIDFKGRGVQDPLSIILSMTEEEKEDERITISIDKMLEEYVW